MKHFPVFLNFDSEREYDCCGIFSSCFTWNFADICIVLFFTVCIFEGNRYEDEARTREIRIPVGLPECEARSYP